MGAGLTQCVRYLLFFFNLIFALAGLGLVILGGLAEYYLMHYEVNHHVEPFIHYVLIGVIVVGAVITVITFFGCCGSVKESHCMLYAFGVFLVTLFVLEIAAGLAAYVLRDQINTELENQFKTMVDNYYSGSTLDYKKIMDGIQSDLHCCGSRGPSDYLSNPIPETCCVNVPNTCDLTQAYPQGCYTTIYDFVQNVSIILLAVGGGVAVVQLIGIIFSFCLANSIRRGYEVV